VAVTAIRSLGAETDGGGPLQERLAKMGQPLYQWPMPDGFPVDAVAWKGSLLARWNFALDLAEGRIKGTSINHERLKGLDAAGICSAMLGVSPESPQMKSLMTRMPNDSKPAETAALCMASSDFQWRHA